jgi:hypothetical protein
VPRPLILLQVVQPAVVLIEPLLVDLGYVQQTRDAFHDFAQAPVALPILYGHQLNGLGKRFVPLGQTLQSLV